MSFKKSLIFIILICFVGSVIVSFMSGGYFISLSKILKLCFSPLDEELSKMDKIVFYNIRSPRIIVAIFVGVGLSVAGAVYQGCFKNPLVEPYILGASSGAAFGAALGILFPTVFLNISVSAFCFSIFAVFLSYVLAKGKNGVLGFALVLSGVIVSSIFMAFVSILKYISDDSALREITFWMMGGLYYSSWANVFVVSSVVVVGALVVWVFSWKLNILSLGDENARALGVNPTFYRMFFIFFATLISSVCVAHVGIIAWVGLMMPHAARLIVGSDNRFLLPLSALIGALYLLVCDTLARTIIDGEIPIGVITSILGAPFLIILIKTKGGKII